MLAMVFGECFVFKTRYTETREVMHDLDVLKSLCTLEYQNLPSLTTIHIRKISSEVPISDLSLPNQLCRTMVSLLQRLLREVIIFRASSLP